MYQDICNCKTVSMKDKRIFIKLVDPNLSIEVDFLSHSIIKKTRIMKIITILSIFENLVVYV